MEYVPVAVPLNAWASIVQIYLYRCVGTAWVLVLYIVHMYCSCSAHFMLLRNFQQMYVHVHIQCTPKP